MQNVWRLLLCNSFYYCCDNGNKYYSFIITGVICEFTVTCLDGKHICLNFIQCIIKAVEFSVAPIIPVLYMQIIGYNNLTLKVKLATRGLIFFNIICQAISIFVPFIFYVDENNKYKHGNYYAIYIIMYNVSKSILRHFYI